MKFSHVLCLSSVVLALPTSNAFAEESTFHPALTDRFTFSAGAFQSDNAFKISAAGSELDGESIDFGNTIGVQKSSTIADVQMKWKFGDTRKWSIAGQYFSNDATGKSTLKEDVTWRDLTLREGSFVDGGVDIEVIRVFLGRSLILDERNDLGVGVGIHNLDLSAFVGGDVMINEFDSGYKQEKVSASGILPNVGAWYNFAAGRKWLLHARLDWISANIDEYDGTMWNTNAGVTFQAWSNIGFDLSYQYFNLDLDVSKSTWNGGVDMTYSGPVVSVTANW